MNGFTGQNVAAVTLKKQSDVVIKKVLSDYAEVTLPADTEVLEPGQVLITTDGGDTFTVPADADAEPNGILCEPLTSTGKAEVLVCGVVREKYLVDYVADYKTHLFANKIILK